MTIFKTIMIITFRDMLENRWKIGGKCENIHEKQVDLDQCRLIPGSLLYYLLSSSMFRSGAIFDLFLFSTRFQIVALFA